MKFVYNVYTVLTNLRDTRLVGLSRDALYWKKKNLLMRMTWHICVAGMPVYYANRSGEILRISRRNSVPQQLSYMAHGQNYGY